MRENVTIDKITMFTNSFFVQSSITKTHCCGHTTHAGKKATQH